MTCNGCKGAVERIVGKLEGVEHFETNVERKELLVRGSVDPDAVLQKLAPWSKAANKEVRYEGAD